MVDVKENRERYRMYLEGMTDVEIAEKVICSDGCIRGWREKRKLPGNRGLPVEIHNKYIDEKDANKNREYYLKKSIVFVKSFIKCTVSVCFNKNETYIVISKDDVSVKFMFPGFYSQDFVCDYEYENYVDEKIKSAFCHFIRKYYERKA